MNISSNYDYSSQLSSTQELLRLLQKRNVQDTASSQGTTSVQDLFQTLDNTSQSEKVQKPVSPLSELVSDGIITSEQEQAIKQALDAARRAYQTKSGAENASGNSSFKDPLASLVSAGTITEDQKTAVKSALDSMKKNHGMPPPPPQMSQDDKSDSLSNVLDSLVTDGTLTEDQETSILSALESAFQSKASGQKTGTGTADETDPLDSLVAAGTITEDQKDEIKSAFEEAMSSHRMPPSPPPQMTQNESSSTLMSVLDSLVESDTITSDQQQYIASAFQSAMDAYSSQSSFSYMGLLSNSYEAGV